MKLVKVVNKETKVVKELEKQLAAMYLGTNDWVIYKEETKPAKEEPKKNVNNKK